MRSSSVIYVVVTAVFTCGSPGSPVLAQDVVDLGEIVLSGGLAPIEMEKYSRAYTIVSAQDIEQRGLTTVQDVLRAVPGLSVVTAGTNFTQIRIRGGEANHTLVLINGVPAQAGGGEYTFANLDATHIERVEILRGPQSVYYGSGASAGVVNIITKQADRSGYGLKAEVGNGSLVSGYVQARGAAAGIRLSIADLRDHGYDFSGQDGESDFTYRKTLGLDGDWQISDVAKMSFGLQAANTHYAYDYNDDYALNADDYIIDTPNAFTWRKERTANLGLDIGAENDRILHHFGASQTENSYKWDPSGSWTKSRTQIAKYRASLGLDGAAQDADHLAIFMAEHYRDGLSNGTIRRHQNSIALEYRGRLADSFDLQAGLRHDHDTMFGNFLSWNAGLSYQLSEGLRLHSSVGKAYVKPTAYEIANKAYGQSLVPEENRSIDLGVALEQGDLSGDVTIFYGKLLNEIDLVGGWPSPDPLQYFNDIGEGRQKGIEVSGRWAATDAWEFGLNYSRLWAHKPDEDVAVRRPGHELGLNATWLSPDNKTSLTGSLRYVADLYSITPVGVQKIRNFTVLDVAGQYRLNENTQLTARVSNLLDQTYSEDWGYKGPGRTAWIGLKSNF